MTKWTYLINLREAADKIVSSQREIHIAILREQLRVTFPDLNVYDVRDVVLRMVRDGNVELNDGKVITKG